MTTDQIYLSEFPLSERLFIRRTYRYILILGKNWPLGTLSENWARETLQPILKILISHQEVPLSEILSV